MRTGSVYVPLRTAPGTAAARTPNHANIPGMRFTRSQLCSGRRQHRDALPVRGGFGGSAALCTRTALRRGCGSIPSRARARARRNRSAHGVGMAPSMAGWMGEYTCMLPGMRSIYEGGVSSSCKLSSGGGPPPAPRETFTRNASIQTLLQICTHPKYYLFFFLLLYQ